MEKRKIRRTLAEELIDNRLRAIKDYLRKDQLSFYDLCRLFEVSPLGMTRLMERDEELRTKIENLKTLPGNKKKVEDILTKSREELLALEQGERDIVLRERGLIRVPEGFCTYNSDGRLVGDYETLMIRFIEDRGGKPFDFLRFCGKEVFLRQIVKDRLKVYELFSLGFKNHEIKGYLQEESSELSEMTDYFLAVFHQMVPQSHSYNAYQYDPEEGKAKKKGQIKKSSPVRIASEEELKRLFDSGATLKQIIMITGDQSVVISDMRDKMGLKTIYKDQERTASGRVKVGYEYKKKDVKKQMFDAYVSEENVEKTQEELAEEFGVSRNTFLKNVNSYLTDPDTSDHEKKAYLDRKEKSEKMRTDRIAKTNKERRKA